MHGAELRAEAGFEKGLGAEQPQQGGQGGIILGHAAGYMPNCFLMQVLLAKDSAYFLKR